MATRISIPTALRQFADNKSSLNVEGATVGEALKQLTTTYPESGNPIVRQRRTA